MNKLRTFLPWQLCLAWVVGLIAIVNIVVVNLFPLEQVRASPWIYVFPFVNTLNCIVTSNAAVRERIVRRKAAWLFMSAAYFLAFHQFIFRTLLSYDDTYISIGIFTFMIISLALYFPRRIWSIGNTWRIVFDSLICALSIISLLQSSIYFSFGINDSSLRAASYVVWVGFEMAVFIGTIFLWWRHKYPILGLTVLSALCILLADTTGTVRSWYPGIYRLTGLPDISFNFLQAMCLMIFAYYSVEKFPEIHENKIKTLSSWEWFYWNGIPRILFIASVAALFFAHPPDAWVIISLLVTFVIQSIVSLTEEFRLLTRISRVNADLAQANTALLQSQQETEQANTTLTNTNTRLVAAQAQLQQALLSAEDLAVEHERTRVAAEIHDGLGGHLSAVKVHLQVAARVVAHDQSAAARFFTLAQEETTAAQRELRRAIEALTAEYQLHPLEIQLAELAQTSQRTGIRTTLTIQGSIQPLPLPVHHALHRVAQEALNNARRHAQATQVAIDLDFRMPGLVELRIADNGVGLPVGAPTTGGHGLRNMANRIEPLGGTISITNQPDQEGVLVWARVPLTTPTFG